MIAKTAERLQAIELRKKGLSYSEILEYVHVSQSSLSLWLHNIKLSKKQTLRLTEKGNSARKLGSIALRNYRLTKTKQIIKNAISEINNISKHDLMLIGTTLYWAEGNKQKVHNPSASVIFSNSDPKMIRLYLKWLKVCLGITENQLSPEIYIHKTYKRSKEELINYWANKTGIPFSRFEKVYFKKNKTHSYRKNRGLEYEGVLRIRVRKSTDLSRKIAGWTEGICIQSGVASGNKL